ncbi:hypothetical protein STENM327S_04672 [Streptomyces tendae]
MDELAVALGCGSRAASMRLHRARARLRTEIDRVAPAAAPHRPHPATTVDATPAKEHGHG